MQNVFWGFCRHCAILHSSEQQPKGSHTAEGQQMKHKGVQHAAWRVRQWIRLWTQLRRDCSGSLQSCRLFRLDLVQGGGCCQEPTEPGLQRPLLTHFMRQQRLMPFMQELRLALLAPVGCDLLGFQLVRLLVWLPQLPLRPLLRPPQRQLIWEIYKCSKRRR